MANESSPRTTTILTEQIALFAIAIILVLMLFLPLPLGALGDCDGAASGRPCQPADPGDPRPIDQDPIDQDPVDPTDPEPEPEYCNGRAECGGGG